MPVEVQAATLKESPVFLIVVLRFQFNRRLESIRMFNALVLWCGVRELAEDIHRGDDADQMIVVVNDGQVMDSIS